MPISKIVNKRAIVDRKALLQELDEQMAVTGYTSDLRHIYVQIFKAALYRGVAEVRRRFEEERIDGEEVVHANTYLVDQLVRCLYDFGVAHAHPECADEPGEGLCIVATGGYGRSELSPFSDIDLMFLLPRGHGDSHSPLIHFILYGLWDLQLKLGHATRTVDESLLNARMDLTVRTSLLESRWLWGNRNLFDDFDRRFFREVVAGTEVSFVESKLSDRDSRHERMGESRYLLEPNIKEGKGGLRDLQTLFWIAKYLFKVKHMDDLVQRGVFTEADARHFRQVQNFLWTVRCHLHYVTGRPEERLTFDVQDTISRRLGYRDSSGLRGVERFMKHYFMITKTVGDLTRVLCAVLEDQNKKRRRFAWMPSLSLLRPRPEGFVLDGDRIAVSSDDAFRNDPLKLLRLFDEAERCSRDIHPNTLRLVRKSLSLVDAKMRADPEANQLFLDMLTSQKDPEKALRLMNESGVFGRFISEFGRIVGQMQYDMYHVHTVDEHTINAIGILHRIESGELAERHPTATRIMKEVESRRVLYTALLLHDIAKGRGGDHSEIGAQIAQELCPRLGLDDWETETVSWLVLHHLLMSRTAFKYDIDQIKTVTDFVDIVQSPERLRLLLPLTGADVDAVGPTIWNTWKETLLSELFYRALEHMEMSGGQPVQRRTQRVENAKHRLRAALADWPPDVLEAYMWRGYPDYWLGFDAETHARHFNLMRAAEREGQSLLIETHEVPARGVVELIVYAPDHAGLFADLAGAIALTGASIVEAKAITLANSMALDTFCLQDDRGAAFNDPDRLQRLRNRIEGVVSGSLRPGRELDRSRQRVLGSRQGVFRVPPNVIIESEASRTHTVIEVNGRDRPGFLHEVTATLTDLGLQISSARISTYGERVVDVFYVKDVFGLKIEDAPKLRRIRRRLLSALREGDIVPKETPAARAPAAE